MVFYTNLIASFCDGITFAPWLIVITKRARNDAGLLCHEQVHARQMKRIGTLKFWWLYMTDMNFKIAMEVEAYRVSIQNGMRPSVAVSCMQSIDKIKVDSNYLLQQLI